MNKCRIVFVLLIGLSFFARGTSSSWAPDPAQVPAGDPPTPEYVYSSYIEVYKDAEPWFGEARIEAVLQYLGYERGIHYGVRPTSDLANGIPPGAGVVILASNSFGITISANNVNDPAAQAALAEFVMGDGVLVAHLADNLSGDSYQVPGLSRVTTDGPFFDTLTIEAPGHLMVMGADGIADTADDWDDSNIQPSCCAVTDMLPILPAGAITILSSGGVPALVEYAYGQGRVVATVITLELGNRGDPAVLNGIGTPWRLLASELAYAIAEAPEVPDPAPLLQSLIAEVLAIELRTGVQNSMNAQLSVALAALEDVNQNNNRAAIQTLEAFIISVENRIDNGILAEQAEQLISQAETIIAILHILSLSWHAG